MKELTKKVIILNNFSSPYISQAIIVLRDSASGVESRAVEDAENIVRRYIERTQKNGQPSVTVRKKRIWIKILSALIIAAITFTAIKYSL